MTGLYQHITRFGEMIPYSVLALAARIAAAVPFWRSGQTKIDGGEFLGVKWNIFGVVEKKIFLFENIYGIPAPLAPTMTHLASLAEFFLPIMLVLGFGTRLGALGLLGMTAFIQFYVFPEDLLNLNGNWSLHLLWAMPLLLIFARGPGAFSLDHVLGKRA